MIRTFTFFWIVQSVIVLQAQDYSNQLQLGQRLKALETNNANLVRLQSLTKTAGGREVWVLEIGSGDRANHAAIAVVGGVEGSHLLSQELALGFAEKLLANAQKDSIKNLLNTTTFYIFPNVSPDASAQYFAKLRYERSGNASATDDDRDGKINEDPYEDLNNDGVITMVRVEDPTGKWRTHPADSRIMVMANMEKGEQGKYILITEGNDTDKDELWNEDGDGGEEAFWLAVRRRHALELVRVRRPPAPDRALCPAWEYAGR